jgi:hypothetical protein
MFSFEMYVSAKGLETNANKRLVRITSFKPDHNLLTEDEFSLLNTLCKTTISSGVGGNESTGKDFIESPFIFYTSKLYLNPFRKNPKWLH